MDASIPLRRLGLTPGLEAAFEAFDRCGIVAICRFGIGEVAQRRCFEQPETLGPGQLDRFEGVDLSGGAVTGKNFGDRVGQ